MGGEFALITGNLTMRPGRIISRYHSLTKCWKDSLGMNSIVSLMGFQDTSRYLSLPKIKKKQPSLAHMEHSHIEECLFMDDFSVFSKSFDSCLNNLSKMLARCEETNLVLNWEKCHFMVKEGIVLGHKISQSGIEVDQAKVDVISQLPYPTNLKGIRSFLGHAGFYRRFIKDFSKIAKPMTQLLMKDAKFDFDNDCKKAFDILKNKLTTAPVIIAPN